MKKCGSLQHVDSRAFERKHEKSHTMRYETHHKATAIKSVVLAEEQVNKPVGQNKKLKNRSHLYLGMDT